MSNRENPGYRSGRPVSRRQFGATTSMAVLGTGIVGLALLDKPRGTHTIVGETVAMGDPTNPITGFYVRPESGKHPGVMTWHSGEVMTESERDEARDLSAKGYAVLVIDRHAGDARSVTGDAHLGNWWLRQQAQVNTAVGVGTPEWAISRLEPAKRV